jgi:hypothetical protein
VLRTRHVGTNGNNLGIIVRPGLVHEYLQHRTDPFAAPQKAIFKTSMYDKSTSSYIDEQKKNNQRGEQ